ncbi:MAG TPA: tetratricopeptide repeat protein [Thermoanaerobaculia bacterium]
MKRLLLASLTVIAVTGCSVLPNHDKNPYESPFWGKYLNTGSPLDQQITQTLDAVRENPDSAPLHNQLGTLLLQKGFPKDAEVEFERAVEADENFYAAWYNLGLVRAANGNDSGARRAFSRTVKEKPGHAHAHFQLGLMSEQGGDEDAAVAHYVKAYSINSALMDVRTNPRVIDSKLTHLAMIKMYPTTHARQTMKFQGTPNGYVDPNTPEAPSPQPDAKDIVTPTAPLTDPSRQPAVPQGTQPAPTAPRPVTPAPAPRPGS